MSRIWRSIITNITGEGNAEELQRDKYRKELSESCRRYEERVKVTPHHPFNHTPLDRDTHHNIPFTRHSVNPSIVRRELINYDYLLDAERLRMEEKEKVAKAAKEVNNIWRCKPILPDNSASSKIPELSGREFDRDTKDRDVHVDVGVPPGSDTWCGPRTQVKTYTQSDLHLSRSQLWEKHFRKERDENCGVINRKIPMTDGHDASAPGYIQRGFYLGCETPSTESSTSDCTAPHVRLSSASLSADNARDSSNTSPQSTRQPCDSAITSFDNDTFKSANCSARGSVEMNESEMPAFMSRGCHDLRDLNRRLQDLSNDQHGGDSTKSETFKPGKRVEFQFFPSYEEGTPEDTKMEPRSPYEAPVQNDPPSFIARSMRNIGRPDDESVDDTSAFSKKPITPPITGRSVISLRLSQPAPSQSEFLKRTQSKHTITDPTAEYRRQLEQDRRQKSAAHSVHLQEQDDCDNAISSDSEVDDLASYDAVDDFDWDAPLTPRFEKENEGCQEAAGAVRQPIEAARSTAADKDVGGKQEAAEKKIAAAKQEANIRDASRQRQKTATAAERGGGAPAAQHALRTETSGRPGQCLHRGRSVIFAEMPQPPSHRSRREAYRKDLACRATHSSYPPAPIYEKGEGRHSQEELALQNSRGQRWGWNFVVVENDAWTLEGLRTNPKTREPVISL
ncbi:hypothetical protein BDV97DRAFT_394699 [Delphinella strobiligena]|nr:hypothetical protein BDV97DRAFT_394699 [Delphinella strobiligena]